MSTDAVDVPLFDLTTAEPRFWWMVSATGVVRRWDGGWQLSSREEFEAIEGVPFADAWGLVPRLAVPNGR